MTTSQANTLRNMFYATRNAFQFAPSKALAHSLYKLAGQAFDVGVIDGFTFDDARDAALTVTLRG